MNLDIKSTTTNNNAPNPPPNNNNQPNMSNNPFQALAQDNNNDGNNTTQSNTMTDDTTDITFTNTNSDEKLSEFIKSHYTDSYNQPLFPIVYPPVGNSLEVMYYKKRATEAANLLPVLRSDLINHMTTDCIITAFKDPEAVMAEYENNPQWEPFTLGKDLPPPDTNEQTPNNNYARKSKRRNTTSTICYDSTADDNTTESTNKQPTTKNTINNKTTTTTTTTYAAKTATPATNSVQTSTKTNTTQPNPTDILIQQHNITAVQNQLQTLREKYTQLEKEIKQQPVNNQLTNQQELQQTILQQLQLEMQHSFQAQEQRTMQHLQQMQQDMTKNLQDQSKQWIDEAITVNNNQLQVYLTNLNNKVDKNEKTVDAIHNMMIKYFNVQPDNATTTTNLTDEMEQDNSIDIPETENFDPSVMDEITNHPTSPSNNPKTNPPNNNQWTAPPLTRSKSRANARAAAEPH
jgi:hypothetical protein